MKNASILGLALAVALAAPPAGAQQIFNPTPSQASASYAILGSAASLAVITSPIWLTSAGFKKLDEGSQRRHAAKAEAEAAAKAKAGPLPPLTVERVTPLEGGAFEVALKHPQAEEPAVVQWPARADSTEALVKVGDVLEFTPTAAGSGWTVAAADGTELAFMPTENAAGDAFSEQL